MKNTLAQSGSPYLHQHADQPVAWQQWSPEARALAHELDRPLFISIGYATCHWCHVMAHESFDDDGVAALLNEHFVPVKIDREERPDVDQFYMTACQASGKPGGWPLTVTALPSGRPFYVATYLPRESVPGRAGLIPLLQRVAMLWKERRPDIEDASGQLLKALDEAPLTAGHIAEVGVTPPRGGKATRRMLEALTNAYDTKNAGFGSAPKFPTWHHLRFLLGTGANGREMASSTLTAIRAGGIWDHAGGGVHRYSTDERWHLPHFEKMLYDQAWALRTYAEAYAAMGNSLFLDTTTELVTMLQADFLAPDNLYFAAWDADSEGEEGRYYTWTWEELGSVLGPAGRQRLATVFEISPEGNFSDEATRRPTGRNVLHCRDLSLLPSVRDDILRLQTARQNRVSPLCDTKRLADVNGMTLTALSAAARYTGSRAARTAAVRLGRAAWATFMKSGELLRSSFGERTRFTGQLDDYAFLAEGYIHLSEITGHVEDLDRARRLLLEARTRLRDPETGAWYVSAETDVPLRMTRYHDEAYASGASALLRCLDILGRIYPDDGWQAGAAELRMQVVPAAEKYPVAYTGTGATLREALTPRGEMTVRTEAGDALEVAAMRLYAPHLILLSGALGGHAPNSPDTAPSSPHVQICTGTVCHAPIYHVEALADLKDMNA